MKKLLVISMAITAFGMWSTQAHADDAKTIFGTKCAKCHGDDGKGQKAMGKHLGCKDWTDPKVLAAVTDEQATNTIKNGFKDPDGKLLMKPQEGLSDDDIKALIAYIRTFKQ